MIWDLSFAPYSYILQTANFSAVKSGLTLFLIFLDSPAISFPGNERLLRRLRHA